jgi:hypothetical protein
MSDVTDAVSCRLCCVLLSVLLICFSGARVAEVRWKKSMTWAGWSYVFCYVFSFLDLSYL